VSRTRLHHAARTVGSGLAAWVVIYVLTSLAMVLFGVAGILGVGAEPLFTLLGLVPTLAFYPIAGWIGWRLAPIGGVGALAAIAATALAPPFLINAAIERRNANLLAEDQAYPPIAERPHSVALLASGNDDAAEACTNLCQRLLYGSGVGEVVVGTVAGSFDPARATDLIAYRVERRSRCPDVPVPLAGAIAGESDNWGHPVSTAVRQRIADGECLIARRVPRIETEWVVIDGEIGESRSEPSLGNARGVRRELHRRVDGRYARVGRHSIIHFVEARRPFFGTFSLSVGNGGFKIWTTERQQLPASPRRGEAVDALRAWLPVPAGLSEERLRTLVDGALAESAASAPSELPEKETRREQLYWAYIDQLARTDMRTEDDAHRLARLIIAPDFRPERRSMDTVSALGRALERSAAPRPAGEALLRRGLSADPVRDQLHLASLSKALQWLPRGTFAAPSDLLDRVVADPALRGRMPEAVERLGDRGAAAQPALFRIIREDLVRSEDQNRHPGAGAAVIMGIDAICWIAPHAAGAADATRDLIAEIERSHPQRYRSQRDILRQALRVMEGAEPQRRERDSGVIESC
jgi:hypothetical protein